MNGVGSIIKNNKNIIINKIKVKDKEKELTTEELWKIINLNDELAKRIYKLYML